MGAVKWAGWALEDDVRDEGWRDRVLVARDRVDCSHYEVFMFDWTEEIFTYDRRSVRHCASAAMMNFESKYDYVETWLVKLYVNSCARILEQRLSCPFGDMYHSIHFIGSGLSLTTAPFPGDESERLGSETI